jgi:hypothetical protein
MNALRTSSPAGELFHASNANGNIYLNVIRCIEKIAYKGVTQPGLKA